MSADPYRTLGLEHDASITQVKRAYRTLASKFHPDKLTRVGASQREVQEATSRFASISAAYTILSDETRKRHYDHIYKYGGFDHLEQTSAPSISRHDGSHRYGCEPSPKRHNSVFERQQQSQQQQQGEKPPKGIGYAVNDPITFILSKGQVRAKTVAGVSIPSRMNMIHGGRGGVRLSISNGQIRKTPSGSLQFTSNTTQFANGKKLSRFETTTIHKDGTKEVLIEGDDYVERRVSAVPKRKRRPSIDEDDLTRTGSPDDEVPWYMGVLKGVSDAVVRCNCATISVQ